MLHGRLALPGRDREGPRLIADDFFRIELNAPRSQQGPQLRGLVGRHAGHRVARIGARLIGLGDRIHERQNVSAAQRELVDRELQRRRQALRMNQHQHADIGIDPGGRGLQRPQIEQLFRLGVGNPGLAHLLRLLVEPDTHGKAGEPGDDGLLRIRELVDQLDDVVFQELRLGRIEEFDRLVAVGGIRAREAEIQGVAVAERISAHAQLGGTVFLFGGGLWIDDV